MACPATHERKIPNRDYTARCIVFPSLTDFRTRQMARIHCIIGPLSFRSHPPTPSHYTIFLLHVKKLWPPEFAKEACMEKHLSTFGVARIVVEARPTPFPCRPDCSYSLLLDPQLLRCAFRPCRKTFVLSSSECKGHGDKKQYETSPRCPSCLCTSLGSRLTRS